MDTVRVLLVEDDPIDAKHVLRSLRDTSFGVFQVTHVQDLRDALADLAGGGLDVVLLDLSLPDSDGTTTVTQIQEAAPNVPVVVLTGYDDSGLGDALLTSGVQDYIPKGREAEHVLQRSLCYAVERQRLLEALRAERQELKDFAEAVRSGAVDTIVGSGGGSQIIRLLDARAVEENERLMAELRQSNSDLQAEIAERVRAEEALAENAMTLAAMNEAFGETKRDLTNMITQLSQVNADLGRKNTELDELNMVHAATNEALQETQRSLANTVAQLSEANEALAQKNAELDEFSYVASHDIQEPLRKLISFSELLRGDLGGDLPEAAAKDLDYITDAARRMQTLVQDLLKLSRAGRTELKRTRVSLGECVDRALTALAGRIEQTSAEVTCDDLPEVDGDITLLTQLYQNLIGNALKFVPGEQRPAVHVTAERSNGGWTLGVRDNGIGIAPEYAEQIFSPFKRLHGRSEYEGSGIGLAICRKTVERHGGRIWVESQPGDGAHFRFTLNTDQEACECAVETTGISSSC
ncbi:MAG: ATP-binding protein [Phycisphaerae bacterium]|jgi:signal transduction histidine kinase